MQADGAAEGTHDRKKQARTRTAEEVRAPERKRVQTDETTIVLLTSLEKRFRGVKSRPAPK
jgi:hypothetical protein